jgi:drug/metabolite transporter (DMT)-like permease
MRLTSDMRGVAAMLAATATFVASDTFMKLVTQDLPPFEVLFIRGVAAVLACAAVVGVRGEWNAVSGAFETRTLLRAAAETLSTLCYVVALARMPIADVIAVLQTAPLILMLGAGFLLRETIGPARVALAFVGFGGAVMVAQPGSDGVSPAVLLAFGAALLIAARDIVGRGVPARIPVTMIILATMVLETAIAGLMSFGLEDWTPPSSVHLTFLGLAGLLVALGHVGLVLAYRLGRTATIAPFFYSFALWGVLSGFLVWGELPNALALLGIALIVTSGVAIVVLDQRRGLPVQLLDAL